MPGSEEPKKPLLYILIPMLATFAIQRTILHHSSPDTHVYVAGFLVHHLFWGNLILIPTAFLLGLGVRNPWRRKVALAVLGFSSAMVLDEMIYLICTDGSGVAYRGAVSLRGAFVLMAIATLFLLLVELLSCRAVKAASLVPSEASSHPPTITGDDQA